MLTISESKIRSIVREELKRKNSALKEAAGGVKSKSDLKAHFMSVLDKIGDDVDTAEIQSLALILDKAVEIAAAKNLKSIAKNVINAMGQKANVKSPEETEEKK